MPEQCAGLGVQRAGWQKQSACNCQREVTPCRKCEEKVVRKALARVRVAPAERIEETLLDAPQTAQDDQESRSP